MKRNRRHNSAAIRFGPALKALFLCLVLGGTGLGYVWQVNQIYALGGQKTQEENRLRELQRQNKMHREHLNYLCRPSFLEGRVKELNLGMGPPQLQQVLRLVEPPIPTPQTTIAKQLVEQRVPLFTLR